jgi:hypothetical protein
MHPSTATWFLAERKQHLPMLHPVGANIVLAFWNN